MCCGRQTVSKALLLDARRTQYQRCEHNRVSLGIGTRWYREQLKCAGSNVTLSFLLLKSELGNEIILNLCQQQEELRQLGVCIREPLNSSEAKLIGRLLMDYILRERM